MHKMKILVAGCVFSSMFGSAWLINEKIKREYVETITFEEDTPIQLTNAETPIDFLTQENVFEKFKPREYVRVVTR